MALADTTASDTSATTAMGDATQEVVQQTTAVANEPTGNLAGILADPTQAGGVAGAYQSAQLDALNMPPSCAADLTQYPDATSCMDPTGQVWGIPTRPPVDGTPTDSGTETSTSDGVGDVMIIGGSLLAVLGIDTMYFMGKSFLAKTRAYKGKPVSLKESIPMNGAEPVSTNAKISRFVTNGKTWYQIKERKMENPLKEKTGTMRLGESYTVVRNGHIVDGKFTLYGGKSGLQINDKNNEPYSEDKLESKEFSDRVKSFEEAAIKENAVFSERAELNIKSISTRERFKAGAGVAAGLAMFVGGVLLAICGGGNNLCLADTNTFPTKITTSNDRLQAMLQASDDFRSSMHALAQTLYPTAATTTP